MNASTNFRLLVVCGLGLTRSVFAGFDPSCGDWALKGTHAPNAQVAASVARPIFDRKVESVEQVTTEEGQSNAVVTLDSKIPSASGSAKVIVNGKAYCFIVHPANRIAPYTLGRELKLIWADDSPQPFNPSHLANQMIIFQLQSN